MSDLNHKSGSRSLRDRDFIALGNCFVSEDIVKSSGIFRVDSEPARKSVDSEDLGIIRESFFLIFIRALKILGNFGCAAITLT